VLELSLREALQLGHGSIGTEHILLGLVREGEGVAAEIMKARGAGDREVRRRVAEEIERDTGRPGRSA
jgi:ATP-dependent Clp protease ATP-binding subunit ClpC